MKKIFLALALMLCLTACTPKANDANANSKSNSQGQTQDTGKKKVTATTSFLYDITKTLAGDFVDVDLIIPAGEDPHLYIPKTNDAKKIEKADLVLFHGLHFEGKMVDILEKSGVNLSENFPKEKLGEMDQDGEIIVDPHFWFDISLYKMATENAAKALSDLVPDHKAEIEENLKNYLAKLDELDEYNKKKLDEIPAANRYLITPHDAFNYFSRAYNIEVVAPQGVSTDSEVANKDIEKTANFIVEKKVPAIFAESTTDPARMEKLRELCAAKGFDVKVISGEGHELFSDSLAPEGQAGDNFIDMYKHNIDLIVDNLK